MASKGIQTESDTVDHRAENLAVTVEVLQEENQRLREHHRRAMQQGYRRTALGLAGIGLLAGLAGLFFPAERAVLFAVASIGLFGAVLTRYLTPERFVAASVGERVYGQLHTTITDLIETLGLSDRRVYVPTADGVVLYIPQAEDYVIPDLSARDTILVLPEQADSRGIAMQPTGAGLLNELELEPSTPQTFIDQSAEALVETFELADTVIPTIDLADGHVTVGVSGSVYGPINRLDHPVPSTLAVAVATAVDTPVELTVTQGDDRHDWLVICTWDVDE